MVLNDVYIHARACTATLHETTVFRNDMSVFPFNKLHGRKQKQQQCMLPLYLVVAWQDCLCVQVFIYAQRFSYLSLLTTLHSCCCCSDKSSQYSPNNKLNSLTNVSTQTELIPPHVPCPEIFAEHLKRQSINIQVSNASLRLYLLQSRLL